MRNCTRPAAVLIAAAIAAATSGANAQSPSLQELLDRTTAYVTEFFARLSNVVAEEHWVQEEKSSGAKRVLRSDFLLVTFPGLPGRMSFRDVFEVDGRSVRDASHQDRLLKLFVDPPQDAVRRAREIEEAGAWFNLADIGTLSDPLITAGFLQPGFRPRFRFERGGLEKSLGPDVRTLRFEEQQRPTVIKSGPDHDLPARGVVWVEEGTGRILKTQLKLGLTDIVTSYRWDDELQMMVPGEMRESYPAPPARLGAISSAKKDDFRGLATYSRFRRFGVRTTETIR